jgi:hypothetical protein
MEVKEYVRIELDSAERGMKRVTTGLTKQECAWRPGFGCNSIGLILFHTARSEDSFVQARLQGKPEVWATGKWYEKLHLPETEVGSHYTPQQVNAFPTPELEDTLACYAAVRSKTLDYLKDLAPDAFEKTITMAQGRTASIAGIFALVISHTAQHVGDISYLRGLQRGPES